MGAFPKVFGGHFRVIPTAILAADEAEFASPSPAKGEG